ncbi:MAG TPA: heterodisulfide reductase-related iron-sulfur binding cluster [Candidatus Binatia bacterium]
MHDAGAIPAGGFAPEAAFLECVHCGLCHGACPTYVELGTEADSPRGRIHLMRALQDGTLALDADVVRHLDLCLGCRGCETACPSGVRYGSLIEAARPWIEARHRRPLGERIRRRLALALLPQRRRMHVALAPLRVLERLGVLAALRRVTRSLPPRWRYQTHLLPDPLPAPATVPAETAPAGAERARAQLLVGCVMPELFGDTVRNTVAVLTRAGCRVLAPPAQGCCGALALHAGERDAALRCARANVDAFEPAVLSPGAVSLVVNAAGCGAMMKEYGALLAAEPAHAARAARLAARVRDATELLVELGAATIQSETAARGDLPLRRVAYHDPCHLAHAQGIRAAPRALLAAIPGIVLVPMTDEDLCCGSAGHYNVMQPETARRLVARKVEAIRASGADLVATANAGCALQLEAGLRAAGLTTRVRHVLDLLAEAQQR